MQTMILLYIFFFSGTVRRALARPYYDKTQRKPHAQSDRESVTCRYLAKADCNGRWQDIVHRVWVSLPQKVQRNTRVTEVARRGGTTHTWVQVCGRAHHSSDAEGVKA